MSLFALSLSKLLFTDTDSLVYKIKTQDVCRGLFEDKSLFDFSDYPQNSRYLILLIKKLSIKWKMNSKEKYLVNLLDYSPKCIP